MEFAVIRPLGGNDSYQTFGGSLIFCLLRRQSFWAFAALHH